MLYLLPQLPCRNRYTEDWIKVWSRELKNLGVQFKMLGDKKPVTITKYFTDPVKALKYECDQIGSLTDVMPEKILCLDIDFPGLLSAAIPTLKLMNPKLKCYGYLHAGSWCQGDIFTHNEGKPWMELGMLLAFDKIFVATEYHKEKIRSHCRFRNTGVDNIEVVGFPLYKEDVYKYIGPLPFEKKSYIVINGRVEQSNVNLVERIKRNFKDESISVLYATNRQSYFYQLNQAKIVISLKTEETFGIGQLEAYVLGSIPLCPNRFAYPEVIEDERLLYDDEKDLMDKLSYLLSLKQNPFRINIEKYEQTIASCMEFVC